MNLLNTMMQSLPKMWASYVTPLSPEKVEEYDAKAAATELANSIGMDDRNLEGLRLKTFGQAIRLALRSRKWGHTFDHTQCIQLNWWLRLSEVGFPEFCGFGCVDWENGCGFGCDHRFWRASSWLGQWRSTIYLPGAPYYEDIYDDLQHLAFVEMAPPIETVPYVAPARPGITLHLVDGSLDAADFTDEQLYSIYGRHYELFESYPEPGQFDYWFAPHPHEHPMHGSPAPYGTSNKSRRLYRKVRDGSRKERLFARSKRQQYLLSSRHNNLELTPESVAPDTAAPVESDEYVVNGLSFEKIDIHHEALCIETVDTVPTMGTSSLPAPSFPDEPLADWELELLTGAAA